MTSDEPGRDADDAVGVAFEDLATLVAKAYGGPSIDADGVVDLAARLVPHTDHVGLTMVAGAREPTTLPATGDVPRELDAMQYVLRQGPCLEALEADDILRAPDLRNEPRWPEWAAGAVERTPVRAAFGVRLRLDGDHRGALNFYSERPDPFSGTDLAVAAVCSTFASLVLQRAQSDDRVRHLENALTASRQIGMAVGVLMGSRLMTEDQAMAELRTASNRLHRRVREIAVHVVETGEVPERPPRPR